MCIFLKKGIWLQATQIQAMTRKLLLLIFYLLQSKKSCELFHQSAMLIDVLMYWCLLHQPEMTFVNIILNELVGMPVVYFCEISCHNFFSFFMPWNCELFHWSAMLIDASVLIFASPTWDDICEYNVTWVGWDALIVFLWSFHAQFLLWFHASKNVLKFHQVSVVTYFRTNCVTFFCRAPTCSKNNLPCSGKAKCMGPLAQIPSETHYLIESFKNSEP